MIRFWITYSTVGVMGSVLIFFSVPLLKQPPPPPQVSNVSLQQQNKPQPIIEKLAAQKSEQDKATIGGKPDIPSLVKYQEEIAGYLKAQEWETAIRVSDKGLESYPGNESLLRLKERAGERGQKCAAVWVANAPVYDALGKRLKTLDVGTLLQVKDEKKTRNMYLYVCDLINNGETLKDVLINASHVTLAYGILDKKTQVERELLVKKAEIKARIHQLEKEILARQAEQNPHAQAYENARKAFFAFSKQVNELIKLRDDATDSEKRIEYGDQLRQMQSEGIRLESEYKKAKNAFDACNNEKGVAQSPELVNLNQELAAITLKLNNR